MSFYSSQNLSRQGPLRLLWTAAHLERQLKRQQVHLDWLLLFIAVVCEGFKGLYVGFGVYILYSKPAAAAVDSSTPGAATEKPAGAVGCC
jgi:hypothetical protein